MQQAAEIKLPRWQSTKRGAHLSVNGFVYVLAVCVAVSALLASWLPLQVSVVTLFLFAGPHNWFELRYFLLRLPVRFGRSRTFFLAAFSGIGLLTVSYVSLPLLYNLNLWPGGDWTIPLAAWNTLMLFWTGLLVWLRGKQRHTRDWSLTIPVMFILISVNWVVPQLFSLAIVYLHPLVALWFLDRHLRRTRPEWLPAYRRSLCALPLIIVGMGWQLTRSSPLADDNGLFWRITQHAGAQLLPHMSSHLLVSVHVFLEMLHYGVWLVALPMIGKPAGFWDVKTVPLARHPLGFPRVVGATLLMGVFVVALLWFGFAVDYSTTRDIYFTVAIAHVLAEAPFLLRMI
ncbi:MAG TPA: hypothetical protein VE135_03960 [Pyrinomonadaceae bacterium]|nr:hypothetical protein [Pyrinomonadaceae bacterium]